MAFIPTALERAFGRGEVDRERFRAAYTIDIASRLAGLDPLAGMMAAVAKDRGRFLLGRAAWIDVQKMIPRLLWPTKPRFISYPGSPLSSESVMIRAFGLTENDQITTPLATLYADAGVIAMCLGMWLAGVVSRCVEWRTGAELGTSRGLVLGATYSFSLIVFFGCPAVEWVLNPLRNLVVVWVIIRVFDRWCGLHSSGAQQVSSNAALKGHLPNG